MAMLFAVLAIGSVVHFFGSVVARAQTGTGASNGSPTPTPADILVQQVLTPPPSPCAPQIPGACPTCTTDVPGASDYENTLPVPSPAPGFNYVVQLVNESDVTILAGVDAAHQGSSTPGGPVPPPIAVEPREGTWVMQPKGAPSYGNILTIDIPVGWEGTVCPQTNSGCGALGPRFWPRTGCRYDIANNLAQCETASCGDAYDCGKQALRNPPLGSTAQTPASIVEWTFNSQAASGYEYPDISLVDGVTLTIDVQAIGLHCASAPGEPTLQFWLSQRQPLGIHGTDLRDPNRCIPGFRLTRGDVGQIIQGQGNPDDVVACFTNCGRYEYPGNPGANCDPSEERCRNWLAFCCYTPSGDPNHVYGGMCNIDDNQCDQGGGSMSCMSPSNCPSGFSCIAGVCVPPSCCGQGGGCWNDGSMPCTSTSNCPSGFSCIDGVCAQPFCACRAFLKNKDCPADVCTHQYSSDDRASQPPFGHCTDVTMDANACIGDDTVHTVFPGGYTWPNDPQTYVSDARAYRIIFEPGGVPASAPITDSGPIPACDSLPEAYGYTANQQNCSGVKGALFAGAALSPSCTKNDDCPFIPGSTPPARSSCYTPLQRCATWACEIAPGGPVSTGGLLCSWATSAPQPTPTPTRQLGGTPPTQPVGPTATRRSPADSDSCAITPGSGGSTGGILLALFYAALLYARRRDT